MALEQVENLKFFYNMCVKEHNRALRNLDEYFEKIEVVWKSVREASNCFNGKLDLKLYDNALTDFSQMGEVLRKFNIQVELSGVISTSDTTAPAIPLSKPLDDPTPSSLPTSKVVGSLALIDLDVIGVPVPTKFVKDYEGDCIITYVKNAKEGLLYITDTSPPFDAVDLTQYFNGTPKRLSKVPEHGVVFGILVTNKYLLRVVRTDIEAGGNVSLYVIDVGELISVPVDSDSIYELPDKYQHISPQAFLCRLLKVTGSVECDPEKFLMQNQYVEQRFRIINVSSNNIADVELMATAQQSQSTQLPKENRVVNPFQRFRCEWPANVTNGGDNENLESAARHNDSPPTHDCDNKTSSGVTEEQRKILYEEPIGTDNAMEAVMGYDPKDDTRICPFYDPKLNGCFKGARCRLEHVHKIKDGWTRDRDLVKLWNRGAIAYPRVGSTVQIVPTHVVSIDTFYAQIPSQNENLPMLREIIIRMNAIETIGRHQRLTKLPTELELVLARYIDQRWYRCKVLSVIDENNIKVFYVDYGNCTIVSLDNVREWDEQFDYYPFQAILCKLDNIEKATAERNAEATDFFRKIVLNRFLKATITNFLNELCLTMSDEEGVDVGKRLCAMKYAKPKEITRIPSNQYAIPV